jgi:hypothetical protein
LPQRHRGTEEDMRKKREKMGEEKISSNFISSSSLCLCVSVVKIVGKALS